MALTRLWPYGGPGHIGGSFAGKASGAAARGRITELWVTGGLGHRHGSFAGKTDSTGAGGGAAGRRRRRTRYGFLLLDY